jgi:hypothetical protein
MVLCIGPDGHVAYEAPHHGDGGCKNHRDAHHAPEEAAHSTAGSLPPGCTDLLLPEADLPAARFIPADPGSVPADHVPADSLLPRASWCFAGAVAEPLASGHLATLSAVVLLI